MPGMCEDWYNSRPDPAEARGDAVQEFKEEAVKAVSKALRGKKVSGDIRRHIYQVIRDA